MTLWALFVTLEVKHLFTCWSAVLIFSSAKNLFPAFVDVSMGVSVSQPVSDLVLPCLSHFYPFGIQCSGPLSYFESAAHFHRWTISPTPALHGAGRLHVSQPEPATAEGFTPGLAQSRRQFKWEDDPQRFPPLISKIKAFVIILWTNSASINKKSYTKQFWSGWQNPQTSSISCSSKGKSGWFI